MTKTTRATRTDGKQQVPRGNQRVQAPTTTPAKGTAHSGWAGVVLGLVILGAAGGVIWSTACSRSSPPGASESQPRSTSRAPTSPVASPSVAVLDAGAVALADAGASDGEAPYEGPYLGAAALTVPVYADMDFAREKMIGYMRSGAKAPVNAKPIQNANCKSGWYKLIPRGYVCGKYATTDMEDPRVRLGTSPPKLDQTVPYQYAYNTKDGTPLYRAVPSREQMNTYEPYLTASKKPKAEKKDKDSEEERDDAEPRDGAQAGANTADEGEVKAAMDKSAGLDGGASDPADAEPPKPWWQTDRDAGRPDIKLSDLHEGSDAIMARRMVKGFFVAVDKQFGWNKRLWYKTTEGLVAPADRMAINKPPTFHGVEIGGQNQPKLPVGFVISTSAFKYELADGKEPERKSKASLHTIAALTGKTAQRKGVLYRETTDGWWLRAADSTLTEPGAPPSDIGPNEKWIDVNLERQTLVAFEGTRPVYATIVSTGKKGATKSKDHSTIQGAFRIREKHITATMDGDGAAPGENPYSIEDVPYVMYFKGSYALHGAFWHNNWGHKMSHGCVNLAPVDARFIFQWVTPSLPQGWHGAWSTRDEQGTLVVIHE